MAVTVRLMAVMAGLGLLYTFALYILPESGLRELDSLELRAFLTKTTAVYFGLATAILGTLAIIVTHRFAGPIFVIKRAVKGMRDGDYSHRLTLRRKDHLKEFAAEVSGLRDAMMERDQTVRDLQACLDEGDLDGARELVATLGVDKEDAPAAEQDVVVHEDDAVAAST